MQIAGAEMLKISIYLDPFSWKDMQIWVII